MFDCACGIVDSRPRARGKKSREKKVSDVTDLTADDIEIYKFVLGRCGYWLAPRKVFARLYEKFCAKRMANAQISFEPFDWYARRAAYWSEENVAILKLLVENALPSADATFYRTRQRG